jgi:hypothetical protein
VADAVGFFERLDGFFRDPQFTFGTTQLQPLAIAAYGNSCGVVAAILEPP